jgi:uncharacterized membrane protein
MVDRIAHLFHLVGFAAYLGAGFSQQQFMKTSRQAGLAPAVRDSYERLSAMIVTKLELPAMVIQLVSGVMFIALTPGLMKQGWLHAKLTAVLVALVLSHLEMFNARAIARLRQQRGDAAQAEIDARKKRHAQFGALGTVAVLAVLGLVVFGR